MKASILSYYHCSNREGAWSTFNFYFTFFFLLLLSKTSNVMCVSGNIWFYLLKVVIYEWGRSPIIVLSFMHPWVCNCIFSGWLKRWWRLYNANLSLAIKDSAPWNYFHKKANWSNGSHQWLAAIVQSSKPPLAMVECLTKHWLGS